MNLGVVKYVTQADITGNVDALLDSGAGPGLRLMGYSARESGSSPGTASFDLVDGATAAGNPHIAELEFSSNTSETRWFGPQGIQVTSGSISLNHIDGEVEVTVYYRIE